MSGELSDSDWVEMEDEEWTDEQLMDDARPGRRTGKDECLLTPLELTSSWKRKWDVRGADGGI